MLGCSSGSTLLSVTSLPYAEEPGHDRPGRKLDLPRLAGRLERLGFDGVRVAVRAVALCPRTELYILDMWIQNGRELHVSGRLGFTYHQGYELELIEPRQGADFYARDLNPDGEIFLHHFGFLVHDLDLQTARLTSQGVRLLVRGRIHSGPLTADFSYLDTRGQFGLITELICMRFLGIHTRIPPPLARYVGRRQMKSGKRALSL
jgi:hypothetical protein